MSETAISIIIPVVNESKNLAFLIPYLLHHGGSSVCEVIVVDGRSDDDSAAIAEMSGAVVVLSRIRSRSVQLNLGGGIATGSILYFVHADAIPPASFAHDIKESIDKGFVSGCYRFKFNSKKWYLKINDFFTRFDFLWCRGGDQSLFVDAQIFHELSGFDEAFQIMEEYDFLERLRGLHNFIILPKYTMVSARKYDQNSWLRVMWANFLAFRMYKRKIASSIIKDRYYNLLRYRNY